MVGEVVRSGAWRSVELPEAVTRVPTMLAPEESRLLYGLTRDGYEGQGRIFDGGPFLGGSTVAFAAGLRAAGRTERVIDVYDRFTTEGYTLADPAGWFAGEDLGLGDSFRHMFDRNLADFADLIEVHEGDIRTETFAHRIEIHFLDLVKDWSINDVVVPRTFSRLTPGAVVIQQDYWWGWCPWVHITMEHLADHLEPVDRVSSSQVYVLTSPIPERTLRVSREDIPEDRQLALLDQVIARHEGTDRGRLEVVKAQHVALAEGRDAAVALLDDIARRHSDDPEVARSADFTRENLHLYVQQLALEEELAAELVVPRPSRGLGGFFQRRSVQPFGPGQRHRATQPQAGGLGLRRFLELGGEDSNPQ